ncbi:hypothetical protein LLH00_07375 [bacterium]|nr:hypothetical protein [bacterium]
MRNQYKRLDVYRCKLQSHDSFAGRVSVYHVLKVKRCLGEGCFYFQWRCRLLDKGGSCRKGYNYPGKNCTGCRYYYDIKEHKLPVCLLDAQGQALFERELEEFELWLRDNLGRRVEVLGRVNHVGPLLTREVLARDSRVRLHGYLVNFAECYLGWTHFEDYVYLRLSRRSQEELRLARGDRLEFEAELTLDEGRLVLTRPGRFDFSERAPERFRAGGDPALEDTRRAVRLEGQPEKCLRCERGRLVDVIEKTSRFERQTFHRELYCLEGIADPELCCHHALAGLSLGTGSLEDRECE